MPQERSSGTFRHERLPTDMVRPAPDVGSFSHMTAFVSPTLSGPVNDSHASPDTPAAAPPSGFWATIREAIRGSQLDFTQVSVGRAVILLAVPMVLEMSMESLFAVVDIFWVSRLGSDAVATVGLTESMLAIVFAIALGLSAASTALVARRVGEHDHEKAAATAFQAIVLGVVVSVLIGIVGASSATALLEAMGASEGTIRIG